MKLLIRIVITSILVLIIAHFMRDVHVENFSTSIIVAIVLGLLNIFVKPILVLFTLPVTIFTLGIFLLVINAFMILLCTKIVGGFSVESFWTALWFSIFLSFSQSVVFRLINDNKKK